MSYPTPLTYLWTLLRRRFRLGILVAALAVACGWTTRPATAQSAGETFVLFPDEVRSQLLPRVTALDGGGYALIWAWAAEAPLNPEELGRLVITDEGLQPLFPSEVVGTASGAPFLSDSLPDQNVYTTAAGEVVAGLQPSLGNPLNRSLWVQRFSPQGQALDTLVRIFGLGSELANPQLGVRSDGGLVAVFLFNEPPHTNFRLGGSFASPENVILREPFYLADPLAKPPFRSHKAVQVEVASDGSFVTTWNMRAGGAGSFADEYWTQRFDAAGEPVYPALFLGEGPQRQSPFPVISAEDGSSVSLWPRGTFPFTELSAVSLNPAGLRPRAPTVARPEGGFPGMQAFSPLDLDGNHLGNGLAVFARRDREEERSSLEARFLNRRGVPQGSIFVLDSQAETFPWQASAAIHDDGSAVVVWQQRDPTLGLDRIVARTLQAMRDDEVCVNRGPQLHCDTANDAGFFEEDLGFGLGPEGGDRALLGDIDGDGEDDFCLRRKALFLCDADGLGAPSELKIRFGLRSHGALLGDLDGDGDDDPCLRIDRRLACDLAHDGPPAEYRQVFGGFGEALLLGDIDGNGRDEACLYRGARFLCDPEQQGSPASFRSQPIGAPGDTPLLGDVDGDGRDDLCVVDSQNRLLCDVARDGSPPVLFAGGEAFELEPGDRLLMGNIDGF